MDDFGSRVKARREAVGLTQSELAEMAGIEKTAIYRAEAGRVYPRADTCRRIAKALGCPLCELLEAKSE